MLMGVWGSDFSEVRAVVQMRAANFQTEKKIIFEVKLTIFRQNVMDGCAVCHVQCFFSRFT